MQHVLVSVGRRVRLVPLLFVREEDQTDMSVTSCVTFYHLVFVNGRLVGGLSFQWDLIMHLLLWLMMYV